MTPAAKTAPLDPVAAAYLGCCHARGWRPTAAGLAAFRRDVERGARDERGVMVWPKPSWPSGREAGPSSS